MQDINEKFSVVQFFTDGNYEYVRRHVNADEATKAVAHYTNNVATRLGIVSRVIVTDAGDCTVFEWTKENGIVCPIQRKRTNLTTE